MLNKRDNMTDVFPYVMKDEALRYLKKFTYNIEGQTYYFKQCRYIFQELVVAEIFKMLDLPCAEYEMVKLWNQYYLMSPTFRKKDYEYKTGTEILEDFTEKCSSQDLKDLGINIKDYGINGLNNIETMWLALDDKGINQEDITNIINGLIKYYSMQIILSDSDMHGENYEIAVNGDRAFLAPKFDNEGCFSYTQDIVFTVDGEDALNDPISSLIRFMSLSDRSSYEIFLDLFYECTPYLVETAIANVMNKYKDEMFKYFNTCDLGRMDLFCQRRFEKNRELLEYALFEMGHYR